VGNPVLNEYNIFIDIKKNCSTVNLYPLYAFKKYEKKLGRSISIQAKNLKLAKFYAFKTNLILEISALRLG